MYNNVFGYHTQYVFGSSHFQKLFFSHPPKLALFGLNWGESKWPGHFCLIVLNFFASKISVKLPPKKKVVSDPSSVAFSTLYWIFLTGSLTVFRYCLVLSGVPPASGEKLLESVKTLLGDICSVSLQNHDVRDIWRFGKGRLLTGENQLSLL